MNKPHIALKISRQTMGTELHLTFAGVLNENAVLPEFTAGEIVGKLVVHLADVTMINSLGCRVWSKWIKSIHAPQGVILRECSAAFISQVNVLQNFIPSGVVMESMQIPYECTNCNHYDQVVAPLADATKALDTMPCPRCGAQMELNVVRARYFSFLDKKSA